MKAILTRAYACAPEGHTVLKFDAGSTVLGRIATMALADGAAIEASDVEPAEYKISVPPETKAKRQKSRTNSMKEKD